MLPLALDLEQLTSGVAKVYWPLVRVSGVLAVAPVLGSPLVPVRIRVVIAVVLTMAMLPLTGPMPDVDPLSMSAVMITINQLIIGLVIGFVLLIVFNVMNVAGESISASMGLGFALMADPTSNVQVPVLTQFLTILATIIFLAIDGHHALINMMATSFSVVPVSESISPDGFWQMVEWSAILFRGAILIALPALVTMLCVNVVMGVMTRSAPQLNIFSVGFPITMLAGFIVIMLTMPGFGPGFQRLLIDGFDTMLSILTGMVLP
ncbi:MAG: flagellar biosynthetic protein FliR [Gammaproteobacteria bacterium]|nr:flagellar biosynthetic protein FliR [Gammaproteobacteria bacterium]